MNPPSLPSPWWIPICVLITSVIVAVILGTLVFPPMDSTPHIATGTVHARVVDKFFDQSMYGGYKIRLPESLYSTSGEVYNLIEVNRNYTFTITYFNMTMPMAGNINSTKITSVSEEDGNE
jgi:hypothetical protein